MRFAFLLLLSSLATGLAALHKGKFHSDVWTFDRYESVDPSARVRFVVALKLNNVDEMRETFLDVSNPKSSQYGRHLSQAEIAQRFGPSAADKQRVVDHFAAIPGAVVEHGEHGDMLQVTASVSAIESHMETGLSWVSHARQLSDKKSLRAHTDLFVPEDIEHLISFISLNSPVNHVMPRGAKALKQREERDTAKRAEAADAANAAKATTAGGVTITGGNEEALVGFTVFCAPGVQNQYSPPCYFTPDDIPTFTFEVTQFSNNLTDLYPLNPDSTTYTVKNTQVYCYNTYSHQTCGGNEGSNCTCLAKISPLPKYTQIRVNVSSNSVSMPAYQYGYSNLFALTDVATAHFLADLYNIPQGLSVKHGSNQSVVEFYKEFYSNSDLSRFLSLSGLPQATLPEANVYGDEPNDQSDPGGEAQLDVEYIMALAPGAETFFYSFNDYNPNDPVNNTYNEGFLSYLVFVQTQPYPPLVHSLSYGDVEADIFNASHNGSVAYGTRCDEEFMKMGLRGLTVVFSSGDDGIGNSIIRDDVDRACFKAWPAWPASSPYVTTVGATQMTNNYLPGCGQSYTVSSSYPGLNQANQLLVQCTGTGETVCSGSFGGVITSGGGFSDYANRSTYAPWQESAVNAYLASSNSMNYPPLDYFNSYGRGYPDVSTYGSNYMIYLAGALTRESGTSASAPVFAAMVTLWNDMRLAYGQSPMGFIAPWLYEAWAAAPEAFQDIVTGNNACGVGRSIETAPCCNASYAATPGWDASTGLGSPNFGVLANLVLNNNSAFPAVSAFPTGVAAVDTYVTNSETNNDDEVKHNAIGGIVLGAIATAIGLGLLVWLCFIKGGKAGEPLLK